MKVVMVTKTKVPINNENNRIATMTLEKDEEYTLDKGLASFLVRNGWAREVTKNA